jgi:FkbM family methyltransferase
MLASFKNALDKNGIIKFIKNSFKFISSKFNYTLHVKINGNKFRIPILNNLGFSNITLNDGLWITEAFRNLLNSKNGDFIDIGANVGQTLLELRSVNDKVGYYGFEPNPACAYYIRNLIKKNNFVKSFLIPAGIFNKNTVMKFDVAFEADLGGTLIENLRPGHNFNEKLIVPVFVFDSIASSLDIKEVSLIKIDVEGAELDVLNSLKETLNKYRPFVICEILWAHNKAKLDFCDERNRNIIELAHNIGYCIFRIVKDDTLNSIKYLTGVKEIERSVYTASNRELCDYLLVPTEDNKIISGIYKTDKV